ncbi:MAG TPA: PilN domain-containing protein [Terriglobia bacterium]|nr:PilN domain-containing protein [Terriglobia bacterium]
MIRINLLGETARATDVRAPEGPPLPVTSLALAFGASLVVGLGVVGILGWAWGRQVNRLHQELTKEQAEQARLAAVATENKRYEQEIVEVETRIKTIQELEKARTGPVDLMNSLADSVNRADGLYLLSVKADGGRLILKGESGSVRSITDFIAALKRDGDFYDVHLQQYYQDDENERMNFKFDLDCVYSREGPPALPVPSAPATATTVRGKV